MATASLGFLSMKHATPPLMGCQFITQLPLGSVCCQYRFIHLGEERQSGVKFQRNQFDRRGLNPRPPDLEFKVLTVPSDTPPNWKRMHRNQAKKQSDGLAVLVIKTMSKGWKISYVMGRLTPDSHMEVRCLQVEPREWSRQPLIQVARTPHKPALLTTQPRALPATPSPSQSTHHTKLRVQ